MTSVLLAEDDEAIADPLVRVLRREGYLVDHVDDGKDALRAAMERNFDLVILDLGLPSMDGMEVCRRLRRSGSHTRVLMLTARAEEIDKVAGLDTGADDYVTKPFSVAELQARIRAILRRDQDTPKLFDGFRIDIASRRAWLGDRELELTLKEFDLLALLVAEAGKVVSRDTIMAEVWDTNWYGSTKTLDMHVSSLRRKLGDDPEHPRFLTTVRGVGYRFEA
jgi:DNA-binding response OmpR family regulator